MLLNNRCYLLAAISSLQVAVAKAAAYNVLDASVIPNLEHHAIKILEAAPGKGEQIIHWDNGDAAQSAGRYTFLLYLTPGTKVTIS